MPDSFNHILEQFYDLLHEDGLLPSEYSDLLHQLNKRHNADVSRAFVRGYGVDKERKEVVARLKEARSIPDVLYAVLGAEQYVSAFELCDRLIYLLGGEQ